MKRTRARASSSRRSPPPEPAEDPRVAANRLALQGKTTNSTHVIDFDFLGRVGILDDFLRLSARVGISRDFWEIPTGRVAYIEPTHEFLSTLAFDQSEDGTTLVSFRLMGQTYTPTLQTLAQWFHFAPPDTDYLGYVAEDQLDQTAPVSAASHRAALWPRITGAQLAQTTPDPRVGQIVHPVLRFLTRALGHSIFARGESSLRPRHEELSLLATILRPDD